MTTLPPHVLLKVLKKLDYPDWYNCQLASKSFHIESDKIINKGRLRQEHRKYRQTIENIMDLILIGKPSYLKQIILPVSLHRFKTILRHNQDARSYTGPSWCIGAKGPRGPRGICGSDCDSGATCECRAFLCEYCNKIYDNNCPLCTEQWYNPFNVSIQKGVTPKYIYNYDQFEMYFKRFIKIQRYFGQSPLIEAPHEYTLIQIDKDSLSSSS